MNYSGSKGIFWCIVFCAALVAARATNSQEHWFVLLIIIAIASRVLYLSLAE
jgi:hypothetical protein